MGPRDNSDAPPPANDGERRLLYGRRKGHPLSARQQRLVGTAVADWSIPIDATALDPAMLFDRVPDRIILEIGFGSGEHLAANAQAHPRWGFLGSEPFLNGFAAMAAVIAEHNLTNVRLHDGDAREVLVALAPQTLDGIDLLYPDPWPKRRHRKRRFIGPDTLDLIANALKPGAQWRFATDIADYAAWTLRHVLADPRFVWPAARARDWQEPWPGWPGTRYEAKAIRAGRTPVYLTFIRR